MRFSTLILFAAAFCLIATNSGQAALLDGLALHLPFDEGQGTAALDASGNGNDGTLMGNPQWVQGKTGTALKFNGVENSNYVEIADDPTLNPATEITCAAWIFFDEFHPSAGIISKYIGAGNQRSYDLHTNHNKTLALMANCSSDGIYKVGVSTTTAETAENTLTAGEWNHVAMTLKAGEALKIYVNGELAGEADAAATTSIFDNGVPLLIGTDFQIGGAQNGQPREFTGIIDEVMVFGRTLSEDEIGEIMAGLVTSVESHGKLSMTWGAIKKL